MHMIESCYRDQDRDQNRYWDRDRGLRTGPEPRPGSETGNQDRDRNRGLSPGPGLRPGTDTGTDTRM